MRRSDRIEKCHNHFFSSSSRPPPHSCPPRFDPNDCYHIFPWAVFMPVPPPSVFMAMNHACTDPPHELLGECDSLVRGGGAKNLTHIVKIWHILSKSDTYCKNLTHIVKIWHILTKSDTYCQNQTHIVKIWHILSKSNTYCQNLTHILKIWHIL